MIYIFISVHRVLLPDAKVSSPPINQETEIVWKSDKEYFIRHSLILYFKENVIYILCIIYHNKHNDTSFEDATEGVLTAELEVT